MNQIKRLLRGHPNKVKDSFAEGARSNKLYLKFEI